jgi:hypothetical protein
MCRGANVGVRARCRDDGAALGSCELDTVVVALGS